MGVLDSFQLNTAAALAEIGGKVRYTCPQGSVMDGYSYACSPQQYGCYSANDSCCNLTGGLPSCPSQLLDPPTRPRPAEVETMVCLQAEAACSLFQSICRIDPATELCAITMPALCPEIRTW
jgi:hypothetical protein